MHKNIKIALVALLVIIIIICLGRFKPDNNLSGLYTPQVFTSETSGESISVVFNTEDRLAILNGAGFEGVVFIQATSASGARYVNDYKNLVLWNKGDEITLYNGESVVFSGSIPSAQANEITDGVRLINSTWIWVRTDMSNDEVIMPKAGDKFSIDFDPSGKLSGTTDCNGFFGSYTLGANGRIEFGPFGSTLMYCEGSQEGIFTSAVAKADRVFFTQNGNLVLLLPMDSGSIIFRKK